MSPPSPAGDGKALVKERDRLDNAEAVGRGQPKQRTLSPTSAFHILLHLIACAAGHTLLYRLA
jgi:hypothetical protein